LVTAEYLTLKLEARRRHDRTSLERYRPYAKQAEFHRAGSSFRERLFIAGNQLGKTLAGASELAMHLTGEYPDWWEGRRFEHPISAIAGSESSELTREGIQALVLGPPADEGAWGTGTIPGGCLAQVNRRQGVANAVDTITVRRRSGGQSVLNLKSYDQGRTKWQASTVDVVWFDEEPPEEIYSEGLTRTTATKGIVYVTFTPLFGMTEVVRKFYPIPSTASRTFIQMMIDDAEHISEDERAETVARWPAHEREARARGIPTLGSGRVYPVSEENVAVDAIAIPRHWARMGGMDFGWDHPFAAVELAHDRDTDTIYVTKAHRVREQTPVQHAAVLKAWDLQTTALHAAAVRPWGHWLPWAWPHDALQHDKGSGVPLGELYRQQGLNLLPDRATFSDGSVGVEAGTMEILDRMQTGRFKVFSHLNDWLDEFRLYHREDGKIVKKHDDLLDATRYAVMMLRYASTEPVIVQRKPQKWIV
jgi:phage terminase large subunit-like protein